MTLTNIFTEAFIRGIGKSTAVCLVAGAAASAYYISTILLIKQSVTYIDTEVQVEASDIENEAEKISNNKGFDDSKFKNLLKSL